MFRFAGSTITMDGLATKINRAIGQKVLIKIAIHIDNSMSVAI